MAFILKLARLIPAAVRISLAGGAAYGTATFGVWSDSSESKDKLKQVRESWSNLYELEYPQQSAQQAWPSATSVSVCWQMQ